MTTLKEFLSARREYDKISMWAVVIGVSGLLGLMFVSVSIKEFAKPWIGPVVAEFMPGAGYAIGIPWMIWNLWRADKKRRLYPELPCPDCQKPLVPGANIVIASRHCVHCGKRVIDSEE